MSDKSTKDADIKDMSFEIALKQLEDLTRRLETGEASLEDSIILYERGAKLKAHCEEKLKTAQMRVDQIVTSASGTTIEPFEQG